MKRIDREREIIQWMVAYYCRRHHSHAGRVGESLCDDCQELLEYALLRLSRCPFGEEKSYCSRCRVHCYSPTRREQVKKVMRYVGPRMIYLRPVSALRHLVGV